MAIPAENAICLCIGLNLKFANGLNNIISTPDINKLKKALFALEGKALYLHWTRTLHFFIFALE